MMNNTLLVGRLVAEPEFKEFEGGKRVSNITLAVPRSYKNENGEYEADFIDCVLWDSVAQNTAEYCKKGDLVGVRGRIQTNTYETETGEKRKVTQVVADRVSYLTNKQNVLDEEQNDKTEEEDLEV